MRRLLTCCGICCAGLLLSVETHAQQEAVVEQLAPILAAEDARQWQPQLFERALVAPDSVVRRTAALAAGRIGDLRATPICCRYWSNPIQRYGSRRPLRWACSETRLRSSR